MKTSKALSSKDVNVTTTGGRRLSGEKRNHDNEDAQQKKQRLFVPHQCSEEGHFHVVLGDSLPNYYRYKILDLMGEGTFAKVVELWDREHKQYLACKIVRAVPKYTRDAEMEYSILRRLRSWDPEDRYPYVKPFGSFRIPSTSSAGPEHMCILFPRMGCSLLDWLMFHGTIPAPGISTIAYQLCNVLSFLHARRQMHTDLKPENLLFQEWDEEERAARRYDRIVPMQPKSWRVRVIDFGGCTDDRHAAHSVVSTRHYRAPEVILGTGWMYGADVWSVGCILVELYSGRVLFDTHDNGEHLAQMTRAIGAFPDRFAAGAHSEGQSYFRSDLTTVRWPEIAPDEKSLSRIAKQKTIEELIPASEPELRDLVRRCLDYNKSTRITASEILSHPFIQRYGGSKDPREVKTA